MRKVKRNNLAVSEVLDTVLLLGIAIALFSVLSYIVLSYPIEPSAPKSNIIGFVDGNEIIIQHNGGEKLDIGTKIMVTINNTGSYLFTPNTDMLLTNEQKSNGYWNIGETIMINTTNNPVFNQDITNSQVDITIVDVISNSVIMSGTLKGVL